MRIARAGSFLVAVAATGIAAVVTGCSGAGPSSPPARTVSEADCLRLPRAFGPPARALHFALTDWVDPSRVPEPRNDAEAIVFRHLYESPLELDCAGVVRPGLADRWDADGARCAWTLGLHQDARFSDGTPVTADDVVRAWKTTRDAARDDDRATWIWTAVRPESVRVLGDRELQVRLDDPLDLPELLTRPEFSVYRREDDAWPIGTRGLTATTEQRTSGVRTVTCRDSTGTAVTTFEVVRSADARDAVAPGIDAAVVRSRAGIRFLASLPDVRLTPLPWSRLYLLAVPGGPPPVALDAGVREELARDVAASDARAAESWLLAPRADAEAPGTAPLAGPALARERRIVVPRIDDDAARLAERLAFLWTEAATAAPVRVASLGLREFRDALRSGADLAYVVPVARGAVTADLQRRDLLARAPWIAGSAAVVPLVETRAHLVSRERLGGVVTGYDGAPRLHGAGWTGGVTP